METGSEGGVTGGERAIGSSAFGTRVDLLFVWCVEERGYERGLYILMEDYRAEEVYALSLTLRLLCLDRPFSTPFWTRYFSF